jgi:hypothetical protein
MAINDILKIAVVGRDVQQSLLVCTFHYKATSATIFDTQSEDLAQAWSEDLTTLWSDTFASVCAIHALQVRNLTNPLEGFDFSYDPVVAGTESGEQLPAMNAPVITWTTANIGRRYRGRSFMWPIVETRQNGGQIDGTQIAKMNAFAEAALSIGDDVATSIYTLVVHSAKFSLDTPVTGHISRGILNTQRRRRQNVGA